VSNYHDDDSSASDPVPIEVNGSLLARFRREFGFRRRMSARWRNPVGLLAEHMQLGDSRAALVVSIEPHVVVAAYTDEIDCVAMLRFPNWVSETYPVGMGSRLLTVNTYQYLSEGRAVDLVPGEYSTERYGNFFPIIAEFIAADVGPIEERKTQIDEHEWELAARFAAEYRAKFGELARDGNPYRSEFPAS